MRDIKFRAWDKERNMFINKGHFAIRLDGFAMALDNEWLNHNPADVTLMEFTGLLDKNGKEIYEGDIVKLWHEIDFFEDWVQGEIIYMPETCAYYIDFPNKGFSISIMNYDTDYAQFEVIGNIFQNGDLLNDSEDSKTNRD